MVVRDEPREIHGVSRTIRELLNGQKYSIDYYQREYKWQTTQVEELIDDLTNRFFQDHDDNNSREAVANYGHYFLGSVVISNRKGQKFIIDGQQRLTTLTLLLIYLHNLQRGNSDEVEITSMIFSVKYGKKSFNMEVPERQECFEALFNDSDFDVSSQPETIRNIVARYQDIEDHFPDDIKNGKLPFFIDWLTDNVHLVEITAYSDDDAYTIFETMNDRGLKLSLTDKLKGFLLANIENEDKRQKAIGIWKQCTNDLADLGEQVTEEFFKAWFRSQYAESIRERKKGSKPKDFDRLGTEFHRWIRENQEKIGLKNADDFLRFINKNMAFYTRQYIRIYNASHSYQTSLEDIFHISQFGFTLYYPVLLAPLSPEDDEKTIIQKIRVVAAYIDILLARRLWNWRSISYSTMQYAMFLIMHEIRGKSTSELVEILISRLQDEQTFSSNNRFGMHKMNRRMIHRLLARMTDFLERKSGMPSRYLEYVNIRGASRNPYEVEHIWSNHPKWHQDEFDHPLDFGEYRNRIGGLLLLPKKFNASYRDRNYEEKQPYYFGQNLLAQTLHEKCYKLNPGFLAFKQSSGLDFKPMPHFSKEDLDSRQDLYTQLAELTWNIDRIHKALQD